MAIGDDAVVIPDQPTHKVSSGYDARDVTLGDDAMALPSQSAEYLITGHIGVDQLHVAEYGDRSRGWV